MRKQLNLPLPAKVVKKGWPLKGDRHSARMLCRKRLLYIGCYPVETSDLPGDSWIQPSDRSGGIVFRNGANLLLLSSFPRSDRLNRPDPPIPQIRGGEDSSIWNFSVCGGCRSPSQAFRDESKRCEVEPH